MYFQYMIFIYFIKVYHDKMENILTFNYALS